MPKIRKRKDKHSLFHRFLMFEMIDGTEYDLTWWFWGSIVLAILAVVSLVSFTA